LTIRYSNFALVGPPAEGHEQSGIGGSGIHKYMKLKTVFVRLTGEILLGLIAKQMDE
jgi:hypothetical protein